jgi:TolA-binding protein
VFAGTYRQYPTSSKAPEALLKSAIAFGSAGRKETACAAFREFASKFPGAARGYYGERAAQERLRFGC